MSAETLNPTGTEGGVAGPSSTGEQAPSDEVQTPAVDAEPAPVNE